MLTTSLQTANVPMPICKYEVLDGGAFGTPVRYVTVGQQVRLDLHLLYARVTNKFIFPIAIAFQEDW